MNTALIFLITWLMALKLVTTWYCMEGRLVCHECVEMRGEKTKILELQTKTRTRNPEYENMIGRPLHTGFPLYVVCITRK